MGEYCYRSDQYAVRSAITGTTDFEPSFLSVIEFKLVQDKRTSKRVVRLIPLAIFIQMTKVTNGRTDDRNRIAITTTALCTSGAL